LMQFKSMVLRKRKCFHRRSKSQRALAESSRVEKANRFRHKSRTVVRCASRSHDLDPSAPCRLVPPPALCRSAPLTPCPRCLSCWCAVCSPRRPSPSTCRSRPPSSWRSPSGAPKAMCQLGVSRTCTGSRSPTRHALTHKTCWRLATGRVGSAIQTRRHRARRVRMCAGATTPSPRTPLGCMSVRFTCQIRVLHPPNA
jgi:hypothetical protein